MLNNLIASAADSIVNTISDDSLFIEIKIIANINNIRTEIIHNGDYESDDINYRRTRAKALARELDGQVDFEKEQNLLYGFLEKSIVSLPIDRDADNMKKPCCLIIDNEDSWIKIISRWMVSLGYESKVATNKDDAADRLELIDKKHMTEVIFINDVIGLELIDSIDEIRNTYGVKIVLLTGNIDSMKSIVNKADVVLEKMTNDLFLSKEIFINKLKGAGIFKDN